MARIVDVTAEVIEIPLRQTFVTAQDRLPRIVAQPVVITLDMDDGTRAAGEAAPVEYVTGETRESVLAAVESAQPLLIGADPSRPRRIVSSLREAQPHGYSALAGIEMAVWNGIAARTGVPLWKLFGGAVESVSTDVTLSIVEDVVDRARALAERGFRLFKMKISTPGDLERLLAIHRAVPAAIFRVDANQSFTAESIATFVEGALSGGVTLQLVEQPVPKEDLAELDRAAAMVPVPVMADEAVKTPGDALRVLSETRVAGINVKVMKSGLLGALDIVGIVRAAGRKLMIGCMLESRCGIAASLALACGTGAFDFVDLDSHLLLREEGENSYFAEDGPLLRVV